MALVVAGGLLYGTFMTLFVIPIVYDIICRKPLVTIDIGSEIDNAEDDAAAFLEAKRKQEEHEDETENKGGFVPFSGPDKHREGN